MASGMTTDAEQQRQFQERLARLSAGKGGPSVQPGDLGTLRKAPKSVGNSNGRFFLAMAVLCVLAGVVGYFASDYKAAMSKPDKIDPSKVKLQHTDS